MVIGIYVEHSLHCFSKEMWRQAMAISTQQPDSSFGQAYTGLDAELTEQIRALVARLQDIGLVRQSANACKAVRLTQSSR